MAARDEGTCYQRRVDENDAVSSRAFLRPAASEALEVKPNPYLEINRERSAQKPKGRRY